MVSGIFCLLGQKASEAAAVASHISQRAKVSAERDRSSRVVVGIGTAVAIAPDDFKWFQPNIIYGYNKLQKCLASVAHAHDIYTVNGITIGTLRLDFTRNYNVLSFRHKDSQQYLMVCWLWRLGPYLNSTLWVRSSPGAFSNFFVGGSKVDPKLHPIHKGTCGDTIHSINTMLSEIIFWS